MKFNKISMTQYLIDVQSIKAEVCPYPEIKLPRRATKCSAGYDIFSTLAFDLAPGQTVLVPTGINVHLDDDKCLLIVPRSGLGFKARIQLDNTVGLIDADYSQSDNEGHIWVKLTNDSHPRDGKVVSIKAGDAICQGIIMPYYTVEDDEVTAVRNGGFGSTD